MKVLLLEIKSKNYKCVNKDLAGGMGTATSVGRSWQARLFEHTKRKSVVLPNITIAYLAAIFKRAGWEVEVLEITDSAPKKEADLVLVPSSIVDCYHELEIARTLKQQGLPVGVYGAFASAKPEFFLADADFVIKGEAEAAALKIASKKEWPSKIMEIEAVQDIDELPFPDWSQFSVDKYSYFPALVKKPVITMLASRGCPYACSFYCPYPIQAGRKWRARSVENVIAEMKQLKEKHGVKAIDFRDAIFTLNKERTRELAQRMIDEKLDLIWSCETRLDCLNKELIKAMHQAGLRHFNFGIESANEEVLKNSSRLPIEIKHQEEIINYCHSLGISIAAFYILGLDADTRGSILNTINYAKKLNTLVAQFTVCTPYPGTEFFKKMSAEGSLTITDWRHYTAYLPVLKHKNLSSEELLRLKEKAFVGYYFRLAYLIRHAPRILIKKFL